MTDQDIINLLHQTRDLLAFQRELGLEGLPRSTSLEEFLRGSRPTGRNPARPSPRQVTPPTPRPEAPPVAPAVSMDTVRDRTAACRRCPRVGNATRIFGAGGAESGLLVIIDPPPAAAPAVPVAGPADELLTKMLGAIGLARERVHVTSLVKCPIDREPTAAELEGCLDLLHLEIAALAPRVLCTMGPLAAATLLGSKKSLFALRGRFHSFHERPLMPTLHPIYLLNNPEMKKAAWLDLQAIQKELSRS